MPKHVHLCSKTGEYAKKHIELSFKQVFSRNGKIESYICVIMELSSQMSYGYEKWSEHIKI